MNCRDRMLAACINEPVDRPPIWLMRQAGRYLPEYQALKAKHDFWELMRTPKLSVEVALQPVNLFGMDAAILFSDILVVLDAMGLEVEYLAGGPKVSPMVQTPADLAHLSTVSAEEKFDYIGEALERLCEEVQPERAVIGFAGAPLTLASYLIDGGSSRDLRKLKAMAYREPALYRDILSQITEVVTDLLVLQSRAGADVLQLFDTWSGYLSPRDYEELALPYVKQVIDGLAKLGKPTILYVRNAAGILEAAASSGCSVLSIDHSLRLSEARDRLSPPLALQGNLDPAELAAPPERIRSRVRKMTQDMKGRGYIVNLSQGLNPDTPVEGVQTFVQAVQEQGR